VNIFQDDVVSFDDVVNIFQDDVVSFDDVVNIFQDDVVRFEIVPRDLWGGVVGDRSATSRGRCRDIRWR